MAILRDNGFNIVYSTYRLPPLFLVILMKKMAEYFSKTTVPPSDLREIPQNLNSALLFYTRLENLLLQQQISLPFGSSVFTVATAAL
jgi:hypothetical protein